MATHERRNDGPSVEYEHTLRPMKPPPGTTIRKFTYVQELSDSRPPSFRRRQTTPRQNEPMAHITYAPEFDDDGNMVHSGSVYDKGKTAPLRSWKPVNLHVDMTYDIKTLHKMESTHLPRTRQSGPSCQFLPTPQTHSPHQNPPSVRQTQLPRPQTASSPLQNQGPLSFPVRMPPAISANRSSRCRRPHSASSAHPTRDESATFAAPYRVVSLTPPPSRPSSPSLPNTRPSVQRRPHTAPRESNHHRDVFFAFENHRPSQRMFSND